MSSDFSAIGFCFETEHQFFEFVRLNSSQHARLQTPIGGAYVRAGESDGAEIWIQLDPDGNAIGAHPHFAGASKFRVRIEGTRRLSRGTLLDGALDCTMLDEQEGVPLVVEVPDYALHAAWSRVGANAVLQIAAFPRQAAVYATEAEFDSSPVGKLSAEGAFIPSGMFASKERPQGPSTSDALFAGRVLEATRRQNGITRAWYWSILVKTLGGTIDVVFDDAAVTKVPVVRSVVAGSFVLTARIREPLFAPPGSSLGDRDAARNAAMRAYTGSVTRERSFLRRLLRRT